MRRSGTVMLLLAVPFLLTGCASAYQEGASSLEEQDYEAAIEQFTQAVEADEQVADAYRGLGLAYWEMADYEQAADSIEQALAAGTEATASLYALLGNCYLNLEQYEDAIAAYEDGLAAGDASDSLAQEMAYNLAVTYEQMGDLETAKEQFAAYAEQYPEDTEAAKEAEFLETR